MLGKIFTRKYFPMYIYTLNLFSLGIFASADAAYVLAFSVIMLTTDLHSKSVREKKTQ